MCILVWVPTITCAFVFIRSTSIYFREYEYIRVHQFMRNSIYNILMNEYEYIHVPNDYERTRTCDKSMSTNTFIRSMNT